MVLPDRTVLLNLVDLRALSLHQTAAERGHHALRKKSGFKVNEVIQIYGNRHFDTLLKNETRTAKAVRRLNVPDVFPKKRKSVEAFLCCYHMPADKNTDGLFRLSVRNSLPLRALF